jgi:hypothetical protein
MQRGGSRLAGQEPEMKRHVEELLPRQRRSRFDGGPRCEFSNATNVRATSYAVIVISEATKTTPANACEWPIQAWFMEGDRVRS